VLKVKQTASASSICSRDTGRQDCAHVVRIYRVLALMARPRLGALLDDHGLSRRLTAREHLAYFGRRRGMSGTFLEDRVAHVLSTLDLTTVADRRAIGFSQGERMKVSLGCGISTRRVTCCSTNRRTGSMYKPYVRYVCD
jgi:ABC-type Na+ transport system ATPase subunit NatA